MLPHSRQQSNTINSSRLHTRKTRARKYSSMTTSSGLREALYTALDAALRTKAGGEAPNKCSTFPY
eukprot:4966610-Prymnesium_polylepis.1